MNSHSSQFIHVTFISKLRGTIPELVFVMN